MRIALIIGLIMSAVHLVMGCAGSQATGADGETETTVTTQISVGGCAFAPIGQAAAENPLVAALAASVIQRGVNYVGKALRSAGEAHTWKVMGARNIEFKDERDIACIQIARGAFFTRPSLANSDGPRLGHWKLDDNEPLWRLQSDRRDPATVAFQNGLWLASRPDFFFEGVLRTSANKSALVIEPYVVDFRSPIGSRWFRLDPNRHIAAFVTIFPVGKSVDAKDNASTTIVFGRMSPGKPRFFRTTQEWAVRPALSGTPFEGPWFSLTRGTVATPYTIAVAVSETQGESAFLRFVGEVLSEDVERSIVTELQNALIPERRGEAALKEDESQVTLLNNADSARGAAASAIAACIAANDAEAVAKGAGARSAMRTANIAAAKAGLPTPYPDSVVDGINLGAPAATVRQGCQAAG